MKFLILLFLVTSLQTLAHPHVFMEADVRLDTVEDVLKGIHYDVNLDEMNSALIAMRFPVDSEGNLTNEEGSILTPSNYPIDETELKAYRIRFNGRDIEDLDVQLKRIYMKDIYFTYEIYIPLDIRFKEGDKLNIAIYDKEYYFDYYYDEYTIKNMDGSKLEYDFQLKTNEDITYYMGLMNPVEYEVVF